MRTDAEIKACRLTLRDIDKLSYEAKQELIRIGAQTLLLDTTALPLHGLTTPVAVTVQIKRLKRILINKGVVDMKRAAHWEQ